MDEPIDTIEYRGYSIEIYPDEIPQDPMKELDFLGTFVCFHRRYELGHKYAFADPKDFREFMQENRNELVILPLYMYDHSGIGISTNNSQYPFNCPWDAGQLGYVYVHYDKLRKEYACREITQDIIQKALTILCDEVELYNNYLQGDVFGFEVKRSGERIDGCWGYYGDPEKSGLLDDAKSFIDVEIARRKKEHWAYLKSVIQNSVPLQYRKAFSA